MNPLTVDKQFFAALIAGDAQALDHILVDDFILIDVMSGSEITKPAFLPSSVRDKSSLSPSSLPKIACAFIRRPRSSRDAHR